MKTSKVGIELIKRYEGLRLKAYKPVSTEKYYTIGYGHYGADVTSDMVITEKQAEDYLIKDLEKSEKSVDRYASIYNYSQSEYDALVSFTYNCGSANLTKLTNSGKRSKEEIADRILLYNKAGGKVLAGLTKRRKEEQLMFNTKIVEEVQVLPTSTDKIHTVVAGDTLWGISQKYLGCGVKWRKIYDYNNLSSTILSVGQRLIIPNKE